MNAPAHLFPLPRSWMWTQIFTQFCHPLSSEGTMLIVTLLPLPARPRLLPPPPPPPFAHSQNGHSPQDLELSFVSFYPINPVSFSSLPLPLPLFPTLAGCQQLYPQPTFPLAVVSPSFFPREVLVPFEHHTWDTRLFFKVNFFISLTKSTLQVKLQFIEA